MIKRLAARLDRVVALARIVIREQTAEQVGLAAAGAAFWLVIAVLPTAIAAVSLYGLVVSPQSVAGHLAGLANNGPESLGGVLAQQLRKVAAADHPGLTFGLVVSIALAVWSASAGVYNLERAIRDAYGFPPEEYLRARGRALIGATVVVLCVGVIALLAAGANVAIERVPVAVAMLIAVPTVIAMLTAIIAILYRYSVGHRLPIRQQLSGALVAGIGLVAVVTGFAIYLHFSARYTAVYGAFAGTVIGMIGTYLSVYVVLLGAVLNAQLAHLRVAVPKATTAPRLGAGPDGYSPSDS